MSLDDLKTWDVRLALAILWLGYGWFLSAAGDLRRRMPLS
jgi:hypothetical protein